MPIVTAMFLFAVHLVAGEARQAPFALDSTRPYVYLEFDHVGRRQPLEPGESNRGLWLKFVNNCRLPVSISTVPRENANPGITLEDEVIPTSGPWGVGPAETIPSPALGGLIPPGGNVEPKPKTAHSRSGAGPVGAQVGQQPAIFEGEGYPAEPPVGYSSEFITPRAVSPGESVLFSVPIEHVSPRWYIRVRFTLVVTPPVRGDEEPYSYVEFSWRNIPEKLREKR